MAPNADAIADCVLREFERLPEKRKPRLRNDGPREWVPLAGIVLSRGDKLSCVSLGTGMKCLPANKLPLAKGNVLHDWHAEVLALRAFNRFLLDECLVISTPPYPDSDFLRIRLSDERSQQEQQPFAIRQDVTIHMYCSEAPCGDASMELIMDAQEDATPWTSTPPIIPASSDDKFKGNDGSGALRGRSNFSLLGAVRCKPSRPDAPPTLSKSCTDKLALRQATSLLSSTTALIISPQNAYLESLILPASQHIPSACTRAFSRLGRLQALEDSSWKGGYHFQEFTVKPTSREFAWSRRGVSATEKAVASNLSAVWTPSWQETLIGGVLQGRKQFDPRGASKVCRSHMWKLALQIAGLAGAGVVRDVLTREKYIAVKQTNLLDHRRTVKADVKSALKGWVSNKGDEDFTLDS